MTTKSYQYGAPTEGLRFAVLGRVSSASQKKRGSSLENQASKLRGAVQKLGGVIVREVIDQEGATEQADRKLMRQLLAEGVAGGFDCLMLPDADRLSRGNPEADALPDTLLKNGLRLFIQQREEDLEDADDRMVLGIHSAIGKAIANKQRKKRQETMILRALRGWIGGNPKGEGNRTVLPYARYLTNPHERQHGNAQWALIEKDVETLKAVAAYYLEPTTTLDDVVQRFGESDNTWLKRLKDRAGASFEVGYQRLGIKVDMFKVAGAFPPNLRIEGDTLWVRFDVPRILDDKTIAAVTAKAKAQGKGASTKRLEGARQFLRGFTRCAVCGYEVSMHASEKTGRVYLQHATGRKDRNAACPSRFCRGEPLEAQVFLALSAAVTNADSLEAAIKAAIKQQVSAKPAAAKRREEVRVEVAKLEGKLSRLARDLEQDDVPSSLRARIMKNAADYEAKLGALAVEARRLDAEMRVTVLPPELPEMLAFLKRTLGSAGRRHFWPPEAKLKLMEFLFGQPRRVPSPESGESALDLPGVFLTKRADGGVDWEARARFGLRLSSAGGGGKLDAKHAQEFLAGFDFSTIKHSENPAAAKKGAQKVNKLQRASAC